MFAVIDTNLTTLVTDATNYFADIKALVLTVVVFFILLGFAGLVKRKK